MTNKKLTKKSKWLKLALISTASLSTLATIPAAICAKSANSKAENKEIVSPLKTSTPVLNTNLEATTYVKVTFKLRESDQKGPYPATITGKTVNKIRKGDMFIGVNKPTALKTGFKFLGWTEQDSTEIIDDNTVIEQNKTVYALFGKTSSIVINGTKSILSHRSSSRFTATTTPGMDVDWHVCDSTTTPKTTSIRATISNEGTTKGTLTASGAATGANVYGDVYVFALPAGTEESDFPSSISTDDPNVLKIKVVNPVEDPIYDTKVITSITDKDGATTEYAIDPVEFCSVESEDKPLSGTNITTGNYVASIGVTKAAFTAPIRFGKNITVIPNNFLDAGKTATDLGFKAFKSTIEFSESITHISSNFLSDNTVFNNPLTLPASLRSIDDHFLSGCSAFNSEIKFADNPNIYNIGDNFMDGCASFAKTLEIPASVTEVGTHFMYNCKAQTSITINCSAFAFKESDASFAISDLEHKQSTTHNITVACGESAVFDDFKTLFPNSTSTEGESNLVRCLFPVMDWQNYSAYIENDDGSFHPITSLTTSNMCSSTDAAIQTDDGILIGRADFNSKVYLNPLQLAAIPNYFLKGCTSFNQSIEIPTNVAAIGASFLEGCSEFNHPVTIPNNVTSIGNLFMSSCVKFNSSLKLSNGNLSIGLYFLANDILFNQNIIIPAGVTKVEAGFLHNCDDMVSIVYINCSIDKFNTGIASFASTNVSAACYTQGIKIGSLNAEEWQTFHDQDHFPDRTETPYRTLVQAV